MPRLRLGVMAGRTARERSRRTARVRESTAEAVACLVADGNGRKHFVAGYAPDRCLGTVEKTELPVYVKPCMKNNVPPYSLDVQKEFQPRSRVESF